MKHETSISENLVRDIRSQLDEGGRRFFFELAFIIKLIRLKSATFCVFADSAEMPLIAVEKLPLKHQNLGGSSHLKQRNGSCWENIKGV